MRTFSADQATAAWCITQADVPVPGEGTSMDPLEVRHHTDAAFCLSSFLKWSLNYGFLPGWGRPSGVVADSRWYDRCWVCICDTLRWMNLLWDFDFPCFRLGGVEWGKWKWWCGRETGFPHESVLYWYFIFFLITMVEQAADLISMAARLFIRFFNQRGGPLQ